jgi:hypothetical protein
VKFCREPDRKTHRPRHHRQFSRFERADRRNIFDVPAVSLTHPARMFPHATRVRARATAWRPAFGAVWMLRKITGNRGGNVGWPTSCGREPSTYFTACEVLAGRIGLTKSSRHTAVRQARPASRQRKFARPSNHCRCDVRRVACSYRHVPPIQGLASWKQTKSLEQMRSR